MIYLLLSLSISDTIVLSGYRTLKGCEQDINWLRKDAAWLKGEKLVCMNFYLEGDK